MDPLTHALASYTLKRAGFSRVTRSATVAIVIAGTIADLDSLSSYFGPSAYLTFHRTYFHSLLAAILFSLIAALPFQFLKRKEPEDRISPVTVFRAALVAAVFHLILDSYQSAGVELLWPFSTHQFEKDSLARLDFWILGILLAGILLPTLSRLVTEEIGARLKGPRGKAGASLALLTIILYILIRSVLHASTVATLESRTYRGESPRRVAAFAESGSPFRWHGIVETERALHEVQISVGPAASFDPDSAVTAYKPEPSPALDAARNSPVARRFLLVARFPKATVEKTPDGFHIILREFPATRDVSSGLPVQALIDTDSTGKILAEELAWDPVSKGVWW